MTGETPGPAGDAAAGNASPTGAAEDANSRAEVDVSNPESLARWAQALGVPSEALEGAVKAVGTRVDQIKDYLTGGMAGGQADG